MAEQRQAEAGNRFDGRKPVERFSSVRHFLREYGVALGSGAGLALCFPTWHLFPFAWIALAPLLRAVWFRAPFAIARQFLVCGFAFHLVLLQWLMANVYWAGGWAWWGYVALSFILALFWWTTGLCWGFLRAHARWIPSVIALPTLWAAMDYLQSFLFTGFGWSAIAYSQASNLWAAQWASVGGVPLVGFWVMLCNVLLARAWLGPAGRRAVPFAAACVVVIAVHAIGAMMMGQPDYDKRPFRAAMVQSDFPLEMKWDAEYAVEMVRNTAAKSRELTSTDGADLVVWPEALIMTDIETPGIMEEVSALARDSNAHLFVGAHRSDPKSDGSLNSSYFVDPNGVVLDHYDKIHLAPFGEYVPLGYYLPFIEKVVPAIGDIERGNEPKVLQAGTRKFGPLICFEVLFPAMAENLRSKGADFLVVITNLGWFGASNAIGQELEVARMRAIETRLPLVQCANTGITGVFDPWGRFTGVDVYFKDANTAFHAKLESPYQTIMSRFGGVLPLSSPVARIWESGPRVMPNVFLGMSLLMVAATAVARQVARWRAG